MQAIRAMKADYLQAKRMRLRALGRAMRALFRSEDPYSPYRIINRLQRSFPTNLLWLTRLFVPARFEAAAAGRIRSLVVWGAYGQNVSEAILSNSGMVRTARLCVPPSLWAEWEKSVPDISVKKPASVWLFSLLLLRRLQEARRQFVALWTNAKSGPDAPRQSYCVAMKVAPLSIACAQTGGFLPWLLKSAPLRMRPKVLWVVPHADGANALMPEIYTAVRLPFPRLNGLRPRLSFLLRSLVMACGSVLALIVGNWQPILLLPDLIALQYFAQIKSGDLAGSYIFSLNDLADRPLWTWLAEERGCEVPLVFYASSYSLFGYDTKPVVGIQDPSLTEGSWSTGWYQTQSASDLLQKWADKTPVRKVVGAFDMVDDGSKLPPLPERWLAVFDVEPIGHLVSIGTKGYICPYLSEEIILAFWTDLGEVAKELNVLLVHKPKRPHAQQWEVRYRKQIELLKERQLYLALPTTLGPSRLIAQAPGSIVLPFTSVGDIACALNRHAAYFDPLGTIRDPAEHATGLNVLAGRNQLRSWVAETFSKQPAAAQAS